METRVFGDLTIEQRAGQEPTITGTAACYYDGTAETEYDLGEGLVERIIPGAFDAALERGDDVLACRDHDRKHGRLARTPHTLQLWTDNVGLHFRCLPVATQVYRETIEEIRAGVLRGSSYSFRPDKVTWSRESGKDVRNIHSVTLYDVSPCCDPCNSKRTSVSVRSSDCESEYQAWRETRDRIERAERLLRGE